MNKETLQKLHSTLLEMLIELDRVCRENNIHYFLDSGSALGAVRHGGFIPWDDDVDIGMLRDDYDRFLQIAPKSLDSKYFLQTRDNDKYYNKLHAKLRKNNTVYLESAYDNKLMHCGIFIDIFPFDKIPKTCSGFWIWLNQSFQRMFVYKFIDDGEPRNRFKLWISNIIIGKNPTKRFDKLCKIFSNTNAKGLISYNYFFKEHYVFCKNDFSQFIEVNFEGGKFLLMNGFDNYLRKMYGNYMQLPPENKRITHDIKELKI